MDDSLGPRLSTTVREFSLGEFWDLFLLGLLSKADNAVGLTGTIVRLLVIVWLFLPQLIDIPSQLRNPLHANMTVVVETLTIFLVGLVVSALQNPHGRLV